MIWTNEQISTEEAARRAGVTRMTIHRWIKAGKLPALKIGRAHIINATDLQSCLANDDLSQASPAIANGNGSSLGLSASGELSNACLDGD